MAGRPLPAPPCARIFSDGKWEWFSCEPLGTVRRNLRRRVVVRVTFEKRKDGADSTFVTRILDVRLRDFLADSEPPL